MPEFSGGFRDIMEMLAFTGGAVLFVYKLGSKMDRLSSSIEHLVDELKDHESRLRVLEDA